jgi:LPXTG-motif cell wall-anchored protein
MASKQSFDDGSGNTVKGKQSMTPTGSIRKRAAFALPALAAITGGLMFAAPPSATAAPSAAAFSVTVSDATVQVGETLDVTVSVTGAVDIYAYELALGFDPTVLEYVDDSAQTPISGIGTATVVGSELQFVHTKLGTSPSAEGDLTLATLSFEAIGAGDVALALDVELVGADAVSSVTANAASAEVSVAAPVVPGTPSESPDPAIPGAPAADGTNPISGPDRGSLSDTGAEISVWPIIGAGAALLAGIAFVFGVRRRRAQDA